MTLSPDRLDRWCADAGADPENRVAGRFHRFVLRLRVDGGTTVELVYDDGSLRRAAGDDLGARSDVITLAATRAVWDELADPHAAPRRHDLLSLLTADPGVRVTAGWRAMLRHLPVLTRLVTLLKEGAR